MDLGGCEWIWGGWGGVVNEFKGVLNGPGGDGGAVNELRGGALNGFKGALNGSWGVWGAVNGFGGEVWGAVNGFKGALNGSGAGGGREGGCVRSLQVILGAAQRS